MAKTLASSFLAKCFPALILLPLHTVAAQNSDIHVLCSNGIRVAMQKLLPEMEHTIGRKIQIQFGASAVFKRSIEGGQPFDLAILTPTLVDDLIKQGKIAAGTEVQIATTGIGFGIRAGSPKPDLTTPDGIKQFLLKAKTIAYVKQGASSPAIVNMLNALGIEKAVQSKIVFQPGADRSMASVADGKSDVALGLVSEIMAVSGVELAGEFPPQFQRPVTMAVGIASSTKNREAVDKIVKVLMSEKAAATIKATGLEPARSAK